MAAAVDYCLEREQTDRGIDLAGQVLAIEPLREDIHRALMRLYVQAGRRGAALGQYERCRKLLKREIGTGPEPETERLANNIRTRPRTEYTRCGDIDIAYQVLGQGPIDLLYIRGWVSHVEYAWEYPGCARFLRGLAAFSRLIVFDKRGCGLSEREVGIPTLEERMQDVHSVLDAVGSKKAVILGVSESGGLACLFAATHPERTAALVLHGCFAKRMHSSDYPWGHSQNAFEDELRQIEDDWGGRMILVELAPSADIDSEFHDWFSRYLRNSASRQATLKIARFGAQIDVRDELPSIRVPTLVTRREGDLVSSKGDAEYLAKHIPNATLKELPGEDHVPSYGDVDARVDEIKSFVTGKSGINGIRGNVSHF